MANQGFVPQPHERPDGSYLFELRDDVYLELKGVAGSEKKLTATLWRQTALLPPTETNFNVKSSRDTLAQMARKAFNEPEEKDEDGNVVKEVKVNVPHIEEDIGLVATLITGRGTDGKTIADKLHDQGERASLLEKLIAFAEEKGEFFHTPEKEAHASVSKDGHVETYPLRSRGFRIWLKGQFKREEQKKATEAAERERERLADQMGPMFDAREGEVFVPRPPVIRDQVFADALNELETIAISEGPEIEVHLRVAGHEDRIYVDLCNDDWETVEVDARGWRIVTDHPVKFVRSNTMRPLVRPECGGSVEDLRKILTLDDEDEDDKSAWRLILAWLVQALRPDGGQYPILILLGGQGSAKTNTSRFLRRLVDPSVVKDTGEPRNEHDLYIRGMNSWVIALDNLDTLQKWLSNAICRIATEGGFATRKYYTSREEEVFDALRPFILNGIADVASRPDLIDRALLINLPAIKKNKSLKRVRDEFAKKEAGIFGALLDAVSAGLAADLDVLGAEAELPRLADFAAWAIATEIALGGKPGSFMRAYRKSRGEGTYAALEAEPWVPAAIRLFMNYDEDVKWSGNSKKLLEDLNDLETDEALKRSGDWPKSPRDMTEKLKRQEPALREIGIIVKPHSDKTLRQRRFKQGYYKPPPEDEGDDHDTDETVTETVTGEYPIDIGNSDDDHGPHVPHGLEHPSDVDEGIIL